MKLKKHLLLTTMCLFIIASTVIMPNNVFAADTTNGEVEEVNGEAEAGNGEAEAGNDEAEVGNDEAEAGMSDEFKQILNEEGKLVVTDTTMAENKTEFLRNYVMKYNTDTYYFIASYNEDEKAYYIEKCPISDGFYEIHKIELVFEEKISDDFKSILKDGKLELPTTSKNISEEWLTRYVSSLGNDEYYVSVAGYYDEEKQQWVSYVNKEYTEATIVMSAKSDGKSEQHIVELTKITKQSEEFKKLLNKDGKLEINAVVPASEEDFLVYFEVLIYKEGEHRWYDCISNDFSSCDLTACGETHTVEIVYNYDPKNKEKMQSFIKNFPKDIEYFKVEDMELINYWVNNADKEDSESLDMFSGELKSYLNYNNIEYYVDNRAGLDGPLVTLRKGMAIFKYNDIVYYVDGFLGTKAEHIIYVPNETGTSKEELIAAAQKRINEYLGKEGIATVSYAGKAYDIWIESEYEASRWMWEQVDPNMTLEEFKAMANVFIPTYEKFEDAIGIKGVNETDSVFNVTIAGKSHYIIIKTDSSKMKTPSYKTADMTTDVEISSTSSSIPLDTSIQAEKLTSGTDYEKIIKILNVENSETFDLKLYSNSLEKYVTKLEDGKFEVKIPISKELEGKALIVYYVDANEKVTEHEVTVKDGYAVFTTNHFSIYTLAEKQADVNKDDTGNTSGDDKKEDNAANTPSVDKNNTNTGNTSTGTNPKTGDNILLFVGMLLLSGIGIVAMTLTQRGKYYKNK